MRVNDAIETLEASGYTLTSRGRGSYRFTDPAGEERAYELWDLRMKAQHLLCVTVV